MNPTTIYVSNTGDDSNDGLSASAPKATFQGARAALGGVPDQLLWCRDDTSEEKHEQREKPKDETS